MSEHPLLFISYARKNATIIQAIETVLTDSGFQPWVDRQKLIGGQEWATSIEDVIDRCELVILVVTPLSLASEYVRHEYRTAQFKRKPILLLYAQPVAGLPQELVGLPAVTWGRNHDRATYDLLDSIAQTGVHRSVQLDGPTTLALAYHQHAPSSWQVFHATKDSYLSVIPIEVVQVSIASFCSYLGFTQLDNSNFFLSLVGPFFLGVASFFFNRASQFMAIVVGYNLPEMLIITPQGIVRRRIHFASFRRFMIQQFTFAHEPILTAHTTNLQEYLLAPTQTVFWFTRTLKQMRIHRRLGNSKFIADQCIAAFQHFQQSQGVRSGNSVAVPVLQASPQPIQLSPMPLPSVAHITHTPAQIFIIATKRDRGFMQQLEQRLAGRSLRFVTAEQIGNDSVAVEHTIATSTVVFVVNSQASLASESVKAQYRTALRLGKTIIPLSRSPSLPLPNELQSLQWIMFANKASFEEHMYALIIALAAAGITLPKDMFDGELAVAQALHGQLPPHSMSFSVPPEAYNRDLLRAVRVVLLNGLIGGIFSLVALIFFIVTLVNSFVYNQIANAFISSIALLIAVGSWTVLSFYIRRLRTYYRLRKQRVVPELIVITPQGWVVRSVTPLATSIRTRTYPFTQNIPLVVKQIFGMLTSITLKDSLSSKQKRMYIPRRFENPSVIADTIISAYKSGRLKQ